MLRDNQKGFDDKKNTKGMVKTPPPLMIKEDDPFFGVLKEDQVCINPNIGRPRMAADVLEGMRQYLMIASGGERIIREERVKNSIKEVEKDHIAQKMILRLEPNPLISLNLDKGKGLVFWL